MPPKAATGGDAEDGAFLEGNKAAEDKLLSGLRQFLANEKPPLSADEYEALIPRSNGGPHWTAQEEADLQAKGSYAHILQQGNSLWKKCPWARQLWRLFPLVYRCLPTDLFSWTYQVDVDQPRASPIVGGPFDGQPNLLWNRNYCKMVTEFTMHGFWIYKKKWDFPVMAQLMQLAVICRTNDCRRWRLVNHTEDTFFTELALEFQKQAPGVRTIKDIMDAVDVRMDARDLRPSQFRVLCRDIVTELFKPDAGPLVDGTPGPYKVTVDDLQGLVKVLDRVAPSAERTGLTTGWSAETWGRAIEKARGHIGRGAAAPQPTEGSDLLARAIAFGFMARERDEKIAEREAQIQTQSRGLAAAQSLSLAALQITAPAQPHAPAQAQRDRPSSNDSSSSDPFDRRDGDGRRAKSARLSRTLQGKGKAKSMPPGGEDTEMADRPPIGEVAQDPGLADDDDGMGDFAADADEHPVEPELNERAKADKEAADKWIAETLALNAFERNRSPSPTRGHIDQGPSLYQAPKEKLRVWDEE